MMKYKVGDRVKIKTWEKLEQEYGLGDSGNIKAPRSANGTCFIPNMEVSMGLKAPDRILTIISIRRFEFVEENHYSVKEINNWVWCDYMIEGLVQEENTIFDPIEFRFELLDLED